MEYLRDVRIVRLHHLLAGCILVCTSSAVQADNSLSDAEGLPSAAGESTPALVQLPTKEDLDAADFVAEVEVLNKEALINRALSFSGMMSVEGYSYHLNVLRQWKKGASIAEAGVEDNRLLVELASCHHLLNKQQRYLVVARLERDQGFGHNSLVADNCRGLIPSDQAVDFTAQLEQWFQPKLANQDAALTP